MKKEFKAEPLAGAVKVNQIQAAIETLQTRLEDLGQKLAKKAGELESKRSELKEEKAKEGTMQAQFIAGVVAEEDFSNQLDLVRNIENEIENLQRIFDILEGEIADLEYKKECQQAQHKLALESFYMQVGSELKKQLEVNPEAMNLLKSIEICSTSASVQSYIGRDFWMEFFPGGSIPPEDSQRIHSEIRSEYLEVAR
jgi:hypothetical protein